MLGMGLFTVVLTLVFRLQCCGWVGGSGCLKWRYAHVWAGGIMSELGFSGSMYYDELIIIFLNVIAGLS